METMIAILAGVGSAAIAWLVGWSIPVIYFGVKSRSIGKTLDNTLDTLDNINRRLKNNTRMKEDINNRLERLSERLKS